MSDFSKQYNPDAIEKEAQSLWESALKNPPDRSNNETFYIPMPPPNVTGNLHLGHALTLTIEDIMIRYHRMLGKDALWIPGTDHSGIATQSVVEKQLEKQRKSRKEIGRDAFLEVCQQWTHSCKGNIQQQIQTLGASLNWEKERFTFDAKFNNLVEKIFIDLYKKGIIYRGEYMVNYSPKLESVISDIEVNHEEITEKMYYINYFVTGSDNEILIATTRPETLLADQAIAVHPKDKRYKKLIGKHVILPIVNKEIPIIEDESIDMEFGTGAVKITPAHDPADFAIAQRHGLRTDYAVIEKTGFMNTEAGIFAGMEAVSEARDNIVELLRSKGNLIKIEPYTHNVGFCSRGKCRIESIISTQWFIHTEPLAKKVIAGYKNKDFAIIPDRFEKTFTDWISNLHDWCISRQLWWGHQIPAYYHIESGELIGVGASAQEVLDEYNAHENATLSIEQIKRDDDVLDTWFSSGLWPFAILDWDFDNPGEFFKRYYPANVLETGYDILFFWVIRMLLFGYEYTGESPFKQIYLHGMVLDEHGKKMSKSWGNVIDPLETIADYSADALRLSLVLGNTPGNNSNFSTKTVSEYSLFLNKFWNIMRFSWMNIGTITQTREELYQEISAQKRKLLPYEKWILSRLSTIIDATTNSMNNFDFSANGLELITFIRDAFADFAIEAYKIEKDRSPLGKTVLSAVTLDVLLLMHPYIPHITEILFQNITTNKSLMFGAWPKSINMHNPRIEAQIEIIFTITRTIRNIRAERNIKPGELRNIWILSDVDTLDIVSENINLICGLAKIDTCTIGEKPENIDSCAYGVAGNAEIYIDIQMDTESINAEKSRLQVQIDDKKNYLRSILGKLSNPSFAKNAPETIVRAEIEKRRQAEAQLQKLQEKLDKLK